MLKRLFSRRVQSESVPAQSTRPPCVETLEERQLFSNPTFVSTSADNRGEVLMTFDQAAWTEINASTVNKNSVQMYEAGANGHLGDADDVRVAASIRYTASNGRLLVRGPITAGNGYRIKVVSSRITSSDGGVLDGNFNSNGSSGDGVAGGNFEFQVKNDKSTTPTVRFSTSAGTINVTMRGDVAPKSVKNFLTYANTLRYDNIFFTRSIAGFIIQGGSLQVSGDGQQLSDVVETTVDAPVVNEFKISNTEGTLAFAKQGGDANSATNQFFFNIADNASNLDAQNGGFTVFAQVKGSSSALDAIAALTTANLSTQITSAATDVSTTPVFAHASTPASVVPATDFVIIRRVAQVSKLAAL